MNFKLFRTAIWIMFEEDLKTPESLIPLPLNNTFPDNNGEEVSSSIYTIQYMGRQRQHWRNAAVPDLVVSEGALLMKTFRNSWRPASLAEPHPPPHTLLCPQCPTPIAFPTHTFPDFSIPHSAQQFFPHEFNSTVYYITIPVYCW